MIRSVVPLALAALTTLTAAPLAAQTADAGPPVARAHACDSPQARQFDFWIGEWDVENQNRDPRTPADSTWHATGAATDRVYPVLDGCAIVELWDGYLTFGHVVGFSVRTYDPDAGRWTLLLNWPAGQGPIFSTLDGTFEGGVGRFFNEARGPAGEVVRNRYTFSDVTPGSLRWDAAVSRDGGRTWRETWIMRFQRRDLARRRALLTGPSRTVLRRCAQPRARDYDFLVGDWSAAGQEKGAVSEEARQAWSILEGCAVMEYVAAPGVNGVRRSLRVRSFVPAESRWVMVELVEGRPEFVRWEGPVDPTADDRTLTRRAVAGEPLERLRWNQVGEDAYRETREISRDGGRTWEPATERELERR